MASPTGTFAPSVFGNLRVAIGTVDMGALTSGAVDTGLSNVLYANASFGSSYTSSDCQVDIACNRGSAGTAIGGTIMVLSATAGDVLNVLAIGN